MQGRKDATVHRTVEKLSWLWLEYYRHKITYQGKSGRTFRRVSEEVSNTRRKEN